jgi:hypothetical protein
MYKTVSMFNPYGNGYTYFDENICFPTDKVGTTSHSEYVPIVCFHSGERIIKGEQKKFFYTFKIPELRRMPIIRRYSLFEAAFKSGFDWRRIKTANIGDHFYFCGPGIIFHISPNLKVTVLLCVAVKSNEIFNVKPPTRLQYQAHEEDLNKFRVIVNNEFTRNADHFNVYRNINRTLLPELQEKLDFVYTNNIDSLCFATPPLALPKFRTIRESKQYLKTINEEIVSNPEILKL